MKQRTTHWLMIACAAANLVACEGEQETAIDSAEKANAAKSAEEAAEQEALAALIKKNAAEREQRQAEENPAKDITCAEGPNADFHDEELEAEVRRRLEKPEGDIKLSELKTLRSINLMRGGTKVDYLDPCIFPHLTGLRDLFLGPGKLSDISLLANLSNLESLRVSMNQVSDITPLAKLEKLDRLDLGRTQVKDVKPLADLKNLTELMLDHTKVTDVSPLKSLDKLKLITISGAPVDNSMVLARPGLKIVDE